jgi:hypothetical protein
VKSSTLISRSFLSQLKLPRLRLPPPAAVVASVSEKAMEIALAAVVVAVSDRAAVEVEIAESSPVLSRVFFSYRLLTHKKEKEEERIPPPTQFILSIETATRRNATVVRWPVR